MFIASGLALQNRITAMRIQHLESRERGAAMAEYGLLLALVALAAITILVFFGGEIVEVFTEAEETLNTRGDIPAAD